MPRNRRSRLALQVAALILVGHAQAQSSGTTIAPQVAPGEVVGRWALIAVLRNGEDVTRSGATQGGPVSIYEFKADGTFSITRGESVLETGTWMANAMVTPRTLDHARHVDGQPGRLIPGIYEVGGGVLKICVLPPTS